MISNNKIKPRQFYNSLSFEEFQREILKFYTHFIKHGAMFYDITDQEFENITNIDKDNFKNISELSQQIKISTLNHKKFYEIMKQLIPKIDLKLFKYEKERKTFKNWVNNTYISSLNCCSAFEEHGTVEWPVVNDPLRKNILLPYKKYFYDAMQTACNNNEPIPIGSTIFRGLSVIGGGKLNDFEKSFTSFSYNFECSTIFSTLEISENEDKYMFHYEITSDNIRCPIFSDSKHIQFNKRGFGELVLRNCMKLDFGEIYKFGALNLIKINNITFTDISNIKPEKCMEDIFQIKSIVDNKNLAFCFSGSTSATKSVIDNNVSIYYNKDYISCEQIHSIRKLKTIDFEEMIYTKNYETEIYNRRLPFMKDFKRFNDGKNIYMILQLDKVLFKNFLDSYDDIKKVKAEEIINFALKNYVRNQVFQK